MIYDCECDAIPHRGFCPASVVLVSPDWPSAHQLSSAHADNPNGSSPSAVSPAPTLFVTPAQGDSVLVALRELRDAEITTPRVRFEFDMEEL